MTTRNINELFSKNLISENQKNILLDITTGKVFSFYYELRILLFLGISCLTSGLGIIIYQNIETIGHQIIMLAIVAVIIGGILFVHKNSPNFTVYKSENKQTLHEYLLLLSSVLFGILIGYIQFVYDIFGTYYAFITLVPAIFYFFIAYRYDYIGILSLGITALTSSIGISLKPVQFWKNNFLTHTDLIIPSIFLAIFFIIISILSEKQAFKTHFKSIYIHFGAIILLFATTSGFLYFDYKFLWLIFLLIVSYAVFLYAKHSKLFIFLMLSIFFAYFGLSYSLFLLLEKINQDLFVIYSYYLIFTSIGVISLLINYKSILK